MDYFELREKYGRSASSMGLGSSKEEKQDYEDAMYQMDDNITRAASELERMGYHKKDVERIFKQYNKKVRKLKKTSIGYKLN